MKCLFIYNPKSGRSRIFKYLSYIINRLKQIYESVDIFESSSAKNIKDIVREKAPLYEALIFSGGDGTFNNVISEVSLLKERPVLGYIPSGTANDIAKNLKIPKNIKKALNIIERNIFIEHDIGQINDDYFIYVVGIGAFTDISYTTSQNAKRVLGRLAYFRSAFIRLFKQELLKVKIECEDKIYEIETPLMLILNSVSVGGIKFNKKGHQNNGTFDLYVVKKGKASGIFNLLRFFLRGILGFESQKFALRLTNSKFNITFEKNKSWCCDGEKGPEGNAVITNLRKHIKIYVNASKFNKE